MQLEVIFEKEHAKYLISLIISYLLMPSKLPQNIEA